MQLKTYQGALKGAKFRFAIVESRWNEFLTTKLTAGAVEALHSIGVAEKNIEVFKVPGAFEIPLTARKVAETGRFDAVICVGAVIRGETPHFDYIAGEAASGITRAAMETNVPVVFGVITADTVEQAINRTGVKSGNKGYEAALSAVEVVNLYKEISGGKKKAEKRKSYPRVV